MTKIFNTVTTPSSAAKPASPTRTSGLVTAATVSSLTWTSSLGTAPVADCSAPDFIAYGLGLAERRADLGHDRTAETYRTALRSLARFTGGGPLAPSQITADLVADYSALLARLGLAPNTISFYLRNLRSIYNQAAAQGLTPQFSPFRSAHTGTCKTVKRALPASTLTKIKALPLPDRSAEQLARDLFLFSFYTRGMSFIDMAYLRKTDLKCGVIRYRRRKTGQPLHVRIEPPLLDIILRLSDPTSPYLLPIIT